MAKAPKPYTDPSFEEFVKEKLASDPSLPPSQLQQAYVDACAKARAEQASKK